MLALFNWMREHKKIAAWCFFTWAAIIFVACLIPGREVPSLSIFQYDKVLHCGIFALLAFLFLFLFEEPTLKKHGALSFLVCTAYGYFVETMQGSGITEGRTFDHFDALADSVGAILGVLFFFLLKYLTDKELHSVD